MGGYYFVGMSNNQKWKLEKKSAKKIKRQGLVPAVIYSKDGNKLISCSNDKTIKIWNSKTGKNLMTLKGHSSYIKSICYSSDNSLIISVGNDKIINIYFLIWLLSLF